MSEKIYACLLRLYPSRFRETYGEAARQLFRDRYRDERGFFPKLRLWLDLLSDLALSVPREHRYKQREPVIIGASRQRVDGVPSFHVFNSGSPRLGALVFGGVVSLVAARALSLPAGHFGKYRPLPASVGPGERPGYVVAPALSRDAPQRVDDTDAQEETPALGPSAKALADRRAFNAGWMLSAFADPQAPAPLPKPQSAAGVTTPRAIEGGKLDAPQRERLIHAVIAHLQQHYIDHDVAQKMAESLLAHEKAGDYYAVTDGAALADLLTTQIRDVSGDRHLIVEYRSIPLPDLPPGPSPGGRERYRRAMAKEYCTFEKIAILAHNVGYLKLNSFPDPSVCRSTATATMSSLNGVDALIFDLRDNRGGQPEMVALIASYLFDHPEYLYNPRENVTEKSWTQSPVPGSRLMDKPVFVLTSAKTLSGAEQFCYDLKMLKRATLVGETTGGSAHAGTFYRLDDHFGMGITDVRAVNPFSKKDWEGTGVEPDVKVKAEDALVTAERLAERKLGKR